MAPPASSAAAAASNGATGPSAGVETSELASSPEAMATTPLPRKTALENRSPSQSPSYPRLKCSATTHDSKHEKSRDVAMPPSTRPSISTP